MVWTQFMNFAPLDFVATRAIRSRGDYTEARSIGAPPCRIGIWETLANATRGLESLKKLWCLEPIM